jgi:hypothetical protein
VAWLDTTFSVFCPNMNTVPFSAILVQGTHKMGKSDQQFTSCTTWKLFSMSLPSMQAECSIPAAILLI